MNLLACVVTHNRFSYSRACVRSLRDTLRPGDRLIVVDNASTDGTADLADIKLGRNLFPGAATNIGWHHGLKTCDADLLMRSDNDFEWLPGWRDEVEEAFTAFPDLALLGLHNRHEDYDGEPPVKPVEQSGHTLNVEWDQWGGNVVIPRRLYDKGVRWTPGAWAPGGKDEDSQLSALARTHGLVAGVVPTVCNNMSFHKFEDYPDYYTETARLRGLVPELSV